MTQPGKKKPYSVGAVTAALVTGVALVTRLEMRSRDEQSEGKESEDASKHCGE